MGKQFRVSERGTDGEKMTRKAALRQRCPEATRWCSRQAWPHKRHSLRPPWSWRRIGAGFATSRDTAHRGPGHEHVVSIDCCHSPPKANGLVHRGSICLPLLSCSQDRAKKAPSGRGRRVFTDFENGRRPVYKMSRNIDVNP